MVVWNNKSCFPFWRTHPSPGGCYLHLQPPWRLAAAGLPPGAMGVQMWGSRRDRITAGWIEPIEPGWWLSSPYLGKVEPNWRAYFSDGLKRWNHQLAKISLIFFSPEKSSQHLKPPWLALGIFGFHLSKTSANFPLELRPLAEAEPPSTPAAKPRWKKVGDERGR